MIGFLNINKPTGITSHTVVARIRRLVGRKTKVGHAGTLDPMATGVLPIAIGSATRLIEYLVDAHKGYRATVCLGIATTTDDAEGDILAQRPVPHLDPATLETVLAPLRGTSMQVPPMYSAIHHQGKRLYELARANQTVERTPRQITITRLELVGDSPFPISSTETTISLTFDVECSKGTYIRALARDIGEALGCGAHLSVLERTFVGPFTNEQATHLAALEQHPDMLPTRLLPPEIAVATWPKATLDAAQSQRVRNGMGVQLRHISGERVRVHAPDDTLLALLKRTGASWNPEKVLAQ